MNGSIVSLPARARRALARLAAIDEIRVLCAALAYSLWIAVLLASAVGT